MIFLDFPVDSSFIDDFPIETPIAKRDFPLLHCFSEGTVNGLGPQSGYMWVWTFINRTAIRPWQGCICE